MAQRSATRARTQLYVSPKPGLRAPSCDLDATTLALGRGAALEHRAPAVTNAAVSMAAFAVACLEQDVPTSTAVRSKPVACAERRRATRYVCAVAVAGCDRGIAVGPNLEFGLVHGEAPLVRSDAEAAAAGGWSSARSQGSSSNGHAPSTSSNGMGSEDVL